MKIDGIIDAHHIHVWSLDGQNNYATMHIVTNYNNKIKDKIREVLKKHGIYHVTLELETEYDNCKEKHCNLEFATIHHH